MKGIHLPMKKQYEWDIVQNKLLSTKAAIRQVETETERNLLLGSLLFKIQNLYAEQNAVLYIPESCVDHILNLYHNSLFGAH